MMVTDVFTVKVGSGGGVRGTSPRQEEGKMILQEGTGGKERKTE